MTTWLTVVVAGAFLGALDSDGGDVRVRSTEKDGVRVRVHIKSHDYTVEVTNLDLPPITSFEMEQWNGYMFVGPKDWEVSSDAHAFRSWTKDESKAIRRRETRTFSLRAGSKGAVLGLVQVKVGVASGDSVVIPECWGLVPEPRSTLYVIPMVVLVILVLHTFLVARRQHGAPARETTDS